jgi:hypothetical protein
LPDPVRNAYTKSLTFGITAIDQLQNEAQGVHGICTAGAASAYGRLSYDECLAIAYDKKTQQFDFGLVKTYGDQVAIGTPGASVTVQGLVSPTARNLDDISGPFLTVGGDGGGMTEIGPINGGGNVSVGLNAKGQPQVVEAGGLGYGVPGAEGYGGETCTVIDRNPWDIASYVLFGQVKPDLQEAYRCYAGKH